MHCPFCSDEDTKVIDSRLVADGNQVRRRRECLGCRERYTTYEIAELLMPRVVKQDGSRQPFDESKLRAGLTRALEKRPVSTEAVELAIDQIKHFLQSTGEREILARDIGEKVMLQLQELDEVAFVRFASVYRRFTDISEFKDEIDRCVIWISEHYLLYRVRALGYRRINCRVFPYNISFVVHDKTLWILSVAHSARQPEYWIERKIKS